MHWNNLAVMQFQFPLHSMLQSCHPAVDIPHHMMVADSAHTMWWIFFHYRPWIHFEFCYLPSICPRECASLAWTVKTSSQSSNRVDRWVQLMALWSNGTMNAVSLVNCHFTMIQKTQNKVNNINWWAKQLEYWKLHTLPFLAQEYVQCIATAKLSFDLL